MVHQRLKDRRQTLEVKTERVGGKTETPGFVVAYVSCR